jgi:hypothetical protein
MMKAILFLCASILATSEVLAGVKEAREASARGDYETAFKEYVALAQKGDAKAMIDVGVAYHIGEGVKKDYVKAMDWYIKAFKKGEGEAYNNIGVMYRDGLGVQTNRQIAYALFFITHMRGLGNDGTQIRAGRNLDKTVLLMKTAEIEETIKMTEKYVLTFIEKRGKLDKSEEALKFSKKEHTLKDLSKL